MFRELSKQEEEEFRQVARAEYQPFTLINELWHPVYREECVKINNENNARTQSNSITA